MKKYCWNLIGVAAVSISLLLFALPAFAASALQVKCTDESGKAIANVKVVVQNVAKNNSKDKKSDARGVALFDKLDDGPYRVFGRVDGFAPALYEYVTLKGTQQTADLLFKAGDPIAKLHFEDPAVEKQALNLLAQGAQALQGGKMADAEKLLLESAAMNPGSPNVQINIAIASLQMGKFDQGEKALKMAAAASEAINATDVAKDPAQKKQLDTIAANAQTLLARMPSLKGQSAMQAKNFDQAEKYFEEAAKADPNNADTYYDLSLAQANAKKLDQAAQTIDKAIKIKPDDQGYVKLKQQIGLMQENAVLEKAQAVLTEGDKLYQAKDYAGALKKYQDALPMVPQEKQNIVLIQIGRAQGQLNQNDAAKATFDQALKLAPNDTKTREAVAQAYLSHKQYEEAFNIIADPKSTGGQPVDEFLIKTGKSLSNNDAKAAMFAYERAIKANPQNAEAYYELGAALYFDKTNDARAKEVLTKYKEIGKDAGHLDNANNFLVMINRRNP
jgi:tetratricopeptide (TPR) repeat protein